MTLRLSGGKLWLPKKRERGIGSCSLYFVVPREPELMGSNALLGAENVSDAQACPLAQIHISAKTGAGLEHLLKPNQH